MSQKITCQVIQDLLPNYIEELSSADSNRLVRDHLEGCPACREVHSRMIAELDSPVDVPAVELRFLKKVKRTRLIASALCILVTLGLSCLLYFSEFKYTRDKAFLSAAITEYTAPFRQAVEAYVLEVKELDGLLFATFKDQTRPSVNGVAVFTRGINQRYRIISANIKTTAYSSVVQIFRQNIRDTPYYVISGYNLADEVTAYGLVYSAYRQPGTLATDRIMQSLKFNLVNGQFLEIVPAQEIESQVKSLSEETLYDYFLSSTALYDAKGLDITRRFRLQEDELDEVSCGIGTAERGALYVFIVIILLVGLVITRFFLVE